MILFKKSVGRIVLVGEMDEEMFAEFLVRFQSLESQREDCEIHLMTCGGDIHVGVAMYDLIAGSHMRTTIVCHGNVYSSGIMPVLASAHRVSMPNCVFLLHPWSIEVSEDNFANIKNLVGTMESVTAWMESVVRRRMKDISYWERGLREDVFLTANEALAAGLVDEIRTQNLTA